MGSGYSEQGSGYSVQGSGYSVQGSGYSKFENFEKPHNWHWVSSLGTLVKMKIFGTRPEPMTSANVDKKMFSNIISIMTRTINNIIYS